MTKKKIKKKKKQKKDIVTKEVTPSSVKVTPYPHAGKKIDDFEDKLDEQLGEKTQAKRGRLRKEPMPAQPAFGMDEKIISDGFKLPFQLWSTSQKLPGLALTDTEALAISKPVKQLLDHYIPNFPEIGIAWLSLSISCYSIMSCRLAMIAEIKKEKNFHHPPQKAEENKGPGHGGPLPSDRGSQNANFPIITEPVAI